MTTFANEIINEVAGHECYLSRDDFSGYKQVPIVEKYQKKNTFLCKFESFVYKVMPFGLKNAPAVVLRNVVKYFQEYIYKTMVVYFDD